MNEIKNIAGIAATILVFLGYIPYLLNIAKGKTKPHIYSWLIGGFVALIIFGLQITSGAGIGSFVTLAAGLMSFLVIILGLIHKGTVKIIWIDSIFLVMAIIALGLWLIAKQPVISAVLSACIEVLGFVPTVRKSWNKPYTETLQSYSLNTFRYGLAIFALQKYTLVTAIYPVTWLLFNGFFSLMLVIRRKQINRVFL